MQINTTPRRTLVWFSCGAASAVAAKLAVEKYGAACEVITCDTRSTEHPDNERFFRDVERWVGQPIRELRSTVYASIDDVFMGARYMSGPQGARCTVELKKAPRVAFQRDTDTHVFGYTSDEQSRADDFEARNPELAVEWILIDENVSKAECLRRLTAAGIALPVMYSLGFDHNNCIACVKATSAGYWNRTRRLFPDIFARRATQSRALGVRLARVSIAVGETIADALPERRKGRIVNYRVFLDTLPPDAYAPDDNIECGPVCQAPEKEG